MKVQMFMCPLVFQLYVRYESSGFKIVKTGLDARLRARGSGTSPSPLSERTFSHNTHSQICDPTHIASAAKKRTPAFVDGTDTNGGYAVAED